MKVLHLLPPTRSPHLALFGSLACCASLLLASVHGAAPKTSSSTQIQYRELIDDSVYGHSGRPASDIFEEFSSATPEGIAKRVLEKELLEKASLLEDEINEAQKSRNQNLVRLKKAELNRVTSALREEELFATRVDSFVRTNKLLVEALARLVATNNKTLLSDVEPVCEPAAAVLNDALAQKNPQTFNPHLIELAAFYPRGKTEPAWADLIRTRRFVVYTDGGSYCRMFLPGQEATVAWQRAFPVVRHVLLSLMKDGTETLELDVYAYDNDIAKTLFSLNLVEHSLKVTAKDLGTPTGLTAINMGALRKFFADGLTLEGCGVDSAGQLRLIGSKGIRPTLEGQPIELSDLSVAYRASAYAGHGESYMSLDKAEDDELVNVNFGGRLYDTRMGWVAYRCDLRFKTLGDDYDAVSFQNIEAAIKQKLPDYMSQQRRYFADPSTRNITSEGTRFWFYPDDFKVVTSVDGRSALVTRPRFTAAAERQEASDAKGKKLDAKTPPWTSLTLAHFNKNYDKFAEIFPEVSELDHAARLLGVAEWLYQAKQKGILAVDLDELLTVELPVNPTPRSREQLKIQYAVKKSGVPAEFKAYCISTPQGVAEFERVAKGYEKQTSEWKVMSVIGGGLDYSARKAVERAAKANIPEESLLRRAMTETAPFPAGGGRIWETSLGRGGKEPPLEPPQKAFILASAPEHGPQGEGYKTLSRRYSNARGNDVDLLVVQEKELKRVQQADADIFYKDGSLHSVWLGEHGTPDRFAARTTEGVIAYTLSERNGLMTAKRATTRRVPTETEADLLAAAFSKKSSSLAEVWNLAPVDADIQAIDHVPGKETLICFRERGRDVVRVYPDGGAVKVLRGREAMERMHAASREKVKAFSIPGKVELMHVAEDGEFVVLQMGKRDPIRLSKDEWGEWLVAEGESKPPRALADVYEELAKSDAELVIMRDALQTKPRRLNANTASKFDGLSGFAEEISDAQMEAFRLPKEELDGRISELKKLIENADDLERLAAKFELSLLEKVNGLSPTEKAAELSRLEVEMQKHRVEQIVTRTERDAIALAGVLKGKFQKLRVSYDDPSPRVPERIQREPLVKAASDVALAVPPGEAGVDDKGILRTVAASFEQARVPLIRSPSDLSTVGNVIVITAHNNEALFDYIESLGKHQINGKSALDGKFLMLTTCFEEGNPNMVSELLRRYNCVGVHVQSERVNKDAVRRALVEFSKVLRDLKPGSAGVRLRDLFDESVKRVLQSDDPGIESLKKELEKLLRARVQWCLLQCAHGSGHALPV